MAHWLDYTSYSLYFDGSDMTDDETEFLLAVAAYQKRFRRRFPTWLEVMHVLRCLGYRKVAEPVPIDQPQPPPAEGGKSKKRKPKSETEPPAPP
jgi:hypothetical protein